MDSGGDDAIPLVLALLEASAEEEASVAVGTGPLEDLINDHGDALADAVERTARQSPLFARALGAVSLERGLSSRTPSSAWRDGCRHPDRAAGATPEDQPAGKPGRATGLTGPATP